MRVWSDPVKCVTYVGPLEIRGLCFQAEPDLGDVVDALSTYFGIGRDVAEFTLRRIVERFRQLSLSLDDLVLVIREVSRRSPHLNSGVANGPQEVPGEEGQEVLEVKARA